MKIAHAAAVVAADGGVGGIGGAGGEGGEGGAGGRLRRRAVARFAAGLAALALVAGSGAAGAQTAPAFPSRPLALIVPSTPGGSVDTQARVLGEYLARELGQPGVIDNRAGAFGIVGFAAVAKAAPDGHTLGYGWIGLSSNPAVVKSLPFDIVNDFTAVSLTSSGASVMIASAATGVRNVRELIALAKSDPKKISFGAGEATARLGFELFKQKAGLSVGDDYTVVQYKGGAPLLNDILGGHVGFTISSLNTALPIRNDPRVHILGVIAGERSTFAPEVPTFAEQGVADFNPDAWFGVFAPRGLPDAVTARLNGAIGKALASPSVREAFQKLLIVPKGSTPAEFAALVRSQVGTWKALAQRAKIEPE